MTDVQPQVFISFDTPWDGTFFTLDDPAKGVLDNATYKLSGDVPQDLTSYVRSISIQRGRDSEFDEMRPGVATIVFKNIGRVFDPAYTAGPYFGNITRGKRVAIYSAGGRPLFAGIVDDWDFDYSVESYPLATATCVDGLSNLAGINLAAWTTTAAQTTGQRVAAVLDRPEVSYPAGRDIGTGASTLTNDSIPDGANALAYLQTLMSAENGRLFDSTIGLLTFRDRHYVATHLTGSVIVDDTSNDSFASISRRDGKDTVRNYVKVTTTTGAQEIALNATSIDANGTITLELDGLPLADTTQAGDLADFLAAAYSTPITRINEVSFKIHGLPAGSGDALCGLDIGAPFTVSFTPEGIGAPITQVCVVEGVKQDFPQAMEQYLTLSLSRAQQTSLFILDDATYGVLDGPGLVAF